MCYFCLYGGKRKVKEKPPKPLKHKDFGGFCLEQVKGIEPSYSAWEADVLPLNYTCNSIDFGIIACPVPFGKAFLQAPAKILPHATLKFYKKPCIHYQIVISFLKPKVQ